jgi:hypothetical protein
MPDTISCHDDLMNSSVSDLWRAAVFVHLRIRVAEDRQAEFRSFLGEAIPFYESPGGIRIRLLSDKVERNSSSSWWSTSMSAPTVRTTIASSQIPPWRSSSRAGDRCSLSLLLSRSTTEPICRTEHSRGDEHESITDRVGCGEIRCIDSRTERLYRVDLTKNGWSGCGPKWSPL